MFEDFIVVNSSEEENRLAEIRDVLPKRKSVIPSTNMITNIPTTDHLDELLCHLQCFFNDQRKKDGNDFETDTVSGFQNTPERKRPKTYSAFSFDRINFFNMANLFSLCRKPFVVCNCFCEPIKTFFFWRLSNDCQIERPALISGPPN